MTESTDSKVTGYFPLTKESLSRLILDYEEQCKRPEDVGKFIEVQLRSRNQSFYYRCDMCGYIDIEPSEHGWIGGMYYCGDCMAENARQEIERLQELISETWEGNLLKKIKYGKISIPKREIK